MVAQPVYGLQKNIKQVIAHLKKEHFLEMNKLEQSYDD